MAIVTTEGVVLKVHALGDTSRIVAAYTRDHGLRKFVAKGARKTPSRFGYALEPLSRSRFTFYLKPDRDLHLLSAAEVLDPLGARLVQLERLAHAQAALELVDRLVWGEEPHPELYALLVQALDGCARAPVVALPAVTLAFQLQLASELGYRPRLDACAVDGRPVSQRRAFSPLRGGLVCDACAAREGGVVLLSPDALASLALLLSKPLLEAGEYVELPRSGELMRVIEDFFRMHFQRFQGLRSLEVLRSLEPPAERVAEKPRDGGAARTDPPGEERHPHG
jgi:DNA repair protein RecO (recombination protein O)